MTKSGVNGMWQVFEWKHIISTWILTVEVAQGGSERQKESIKLENWRANLKNVIRLVPYNFPLEESKNLKPSEEKIVSAELTTIAPPEEIKS